MFVVTDGCVAGPRAITTILAARRFANARRSAAIVTPALLALALLAAEPARAVWQEPVDISSPGHSASGAQVAVDLHGDAVAVWSANGVVQGAVRPAGGNWQAPVDLSAPGQSASGAQVAVDLQGNAVAVWSVDGVVQSAARLAGGAWQAPVDISVAPGSEYTSLQVAVDPPGNAVATWVRSTATASVVQSAARPAVGTWQAPVDLSPVEDGADESYVSPAVAVDPQGNAVAIWARRSINDISATVQSAARPARGNWQAPTNLSVDGYNISSPQIAIDPRGDVIAVWADRGPLSGGPVRSAVRPAGGSWQAPVNIAASGYDVQLAVGAQGDALAIWDSGIPPRIGVLSRVAGAVRPAGGAWQAPADISPAGHSATLPQIAVDPQGNAVAVWYRRTATNFNEIDNNLLQGAVRPAGRGWQAPVDLSAAGQDAVGAQIAVDRQGNAVAVWTRSNGTNDIVQGATYDAAGAPPPPRAPAVVTGLRLRPSTFRAARSGATVKPSAARTATRVSYTLNVAAKVRFAVQRARGGRRIGQRCVKATTRNRSNKSCTRWVRVRGSFARNRPAGGDRFTFTGRVARRTLTPGHYRLAATPTANARRGTATRARFRIVR